MKFWQELRRRRVFRLAGLYVVGAWLVVQVGDIVLPAWAVPETAMRYLIVAATLCFPIVLVFAWFYDITPDGIVRTKPVGESETVGTGLNRSDYAIRGLPGESSVAAVPSNRALRRNGRIGKGCHVPAEIRRPAGFYHGGVSTRLQNSVC